MRDEPAFRQLWREAPARARDWLQRVADHEPVAALHTLNPVLVAAVQIWRAYHRGDPAPRFAGELACDWHEWFLRDGRRWDAAPLRYDSPLAGVVREAQPRLVGGHGVRRVIVEAA